MKKVLASRSFWIVLVLLLSIPTFVRMLNPGIYTMQDFPYFRIVEYTKCVTDHNFICRWSPDAGLGYGEPIFNFYAPLPFIFGALFSLFMGSISSLKLLFIFSLSGSAVTMFLLSKKVWGNSYSAIISAIIYLYAPYRAVNVWVRGALPESLAFVLLPLILYMFERFMESNVKKWLMLFSFTLFLLIITHNLSVLLFAPAIGIWVVFRLVQQNKIKLLMPLIIATLFSLCLSAFYLLPAISENHLVNLQTTTEGYFDFRAHFVTLNQLFLSRFWGYGGSTWGPEDGLSLSIGQGQWIVGLLVFILSLISLTKKHKNKEKEIITVVLFMLGAFYLFLTHNKSTFIWEHFSSVMKYIQFPWRFLGAALFSFSLGSGYLTSVFKKNLLIISLIAIICFILLNSGFFHEDIWRQIDDIGLQSGATWIDQTRASIGDYWPKFGPIPNSYIEIPKNIEVISKNTYSEKLIVTMSHANDVTLPITYFPGWSASINGIDTLAAPSKEGFINVFLNQGENSVYLKYHNTQIRSLGNFISFVSILLFSIAFFIFSRNNHEEK